MTELHWTPEAIQDREAIYDYIEADSPIAALALDALFEEKAGRLVDHPGLGRPGRIAGTRELVAHQNYILVYDVAGDSVRVLRVLHAAKLWPPQKLGKKESEEAIADGRAGRDDPAAEHLTSAEAVGSHRAPTRSRV